MQRISVFISEDQVKQIEQASKLTQKPKSEIVREALTQGLKTAITTSDSVKSLLAFAKEAGKIGNDPKDPTDVAINHDYYAWGGKKKQ